MSGMISHNLTPEAKGTKNFIKTFECKCATNR
jgi:hypothetical protein